MTWRWIPPLTADGQRQMAIDHWSRGYGLNCRGNLEQMAAVLGFELDGSFWKDH